MTEDFTTYLNRKKMDHCHGNHVEMQAISEVFNRPIEVYQYSIGNVPAKNALTSSTIFMKYCGMPHILYLMIHTETKLHAEAKNQGHVHSIKVYVEILDHTTVNIIILGVCEGVFVLCYS